MAEKFSPRLIPNWQMDRPWDEPITAEEEEGLATSGLIAGAAPTDRAVTQLMQQFSGDLSQLLAKGRV